MINCIKKFYNWLMILKRYHAVHVFVIPNILYLLICNLYLICHLSDFYPNDSDSYGILFIMLISFIAIGIAHYSFILGIIIEIIILIRQALNKQKIYVQSKFLLQNKVYNILFLWSLTYNLLCWLSLGLSDDILEGPIMALFVAPFLILLILLEFLSKHFI